MAGQLTPRSRHRARNEDATELARPAIANQTNHRRRLRDICAAQPRRSAETYLESMAPALQSGSDPRVPGVTTSAWSREVEIGSVGTSPLGSPPSTVDPFGDSWDHAGTAIRRAGSRSRSSGVQCRVVARDTSGLRCEPATPSPSPRGTTLVPDAPADPSRSSHHEDDGDAGTHRDT